ICPATRISWSTAASTCTNSTSTPRARASAGRSPATPATASSASPTATRPACSGRTGNRPKASSVRTRNPHPTSSACSTTTPARTAGASGTTSCSRASATGSARRHGPAPTARPTHPTPRSRTPDDRRRLQRELPGLPLVLLSALAEGGDQLVAEEALAAGAHLLAPLPLPRELYVEDFTDPASHARFDALCARAEVMQLPLQAEPSPRETGSPGAARDGQYARVGVYIASHCHILLAIWDGKPSHRIGGTAQIVRYHLSGVMPGPHHRHRGARHVLGAGDERLLYHIVCSRDAPDGAPADGLLPMQTRWRSTDTAATPEAEFRRMFAHMAEFNADCARYAVTIDAAASPPDAPAAAATNVDRLFHAADRLALHFQGRVLLALRSTYTLAALMGIAFTCYAHLPGQNVLIYLFLLLFALGALVAVLARRRDWHRKYLDYRALAEGLRIQSYWRRAGIAVNSEHEFVHDNFLQKQNVELGWIRNVMRVSALASPAGTEEPAPAELARVIAEWVGESGKSGQLHTTNARPPSAAACTMSPKRSVRSACGAASPSACSSPCSCSGCRKGRRPCW